MHGEARATRDVDILAALRPTDVTAFVEALEATFYLQREEVQEAVQLAPKLRDEPHRRATFNIIHRGNFFKADIFVSSERRFDASQFARQVPVEVIPGQVLAIASAEDTVLAKRSEIVQQLNPKHVWDIERMLDKLAELRPPFGLDAIEEVCREQANMSWPKAIQEAHIQVLAARAKQIIRLRGLDVEIANIFSFYTSIDWNEKSAQEPTGIPRLTYDGYGTIDSRGRQTIPHYSTDEKVFVQMLKWVKDALGEDFYTLYLHFLTDEGQDSQTATLEQKCVALIRARKVQLKGGLERASGVG